MDASIASDRDQLTAPLKALARSAGGVAAVAVVVAAVVLIFRWGLGAIALGTAGGFLAIVSSTLIVIAAAAATLRPLRPRKAFACGLFRGPSGGGAATKAATCEPPARPLLSVERATSPPPWPEARLVQRIERYERPGPDGSVVEGAVGRVVVRFAEGSRTSVAHVGFCPPFTATPRVAVSNQCDGAEVDVAAAEVLPWGVRIECRLEEPSEEPLDVEVEIVAEPLDAR